MFKALNKVTRNITPIIKILPTISVHLNSFLKKNRSHKNAVTIYI